MKNVRVRPMLATMLAAASLAACAGDMTGATRGERSGTAARTPSSSIDDNWRNEPQARNQNPYMRQ